MTGGGVGVLMEGDVLRVQMSGGVAGSLQGDLRPYGLIGLAACHPSFYAALLDRSLKLVRPQLLDSLRFGQPHGHNGLAAREASTFKA